MKSIIIIAVLVAAVLGLTACASTQKPIPLTVAEAKERSNSGQRYLVPPGNVWWEDMQALFGGKVNLATMGDRVVINYSGQNGHHEWCEIKFNPKDNLHYVGGWKAVDGSHPEHGHAPFFTYYGGPDVPEENHVWNSPLYDPETGEVLWFGATASAGHFWVEEHRGHLQERLPAVTWTECPEFTPAEELGVEVNHKQTARSYSGLIAQDPGRRVLRPDLVTLNPRAPIEDETPAEVNETEEGQS